MNAMYFAATPRGGPFVYMCSYDHSGYRRAATSRADGVAPLSWSARIPGFAAYPKLTYEIAPTERETSSTTLPFESSSNSRFVYGVPRMIAAVNVPRVPDERGRLTTVIGTSGPPRARQFATAPEKMLRSCATLRFFTR